MQVRQVMHTSVFVSLPAYPTSRSREASLPSVGEHITYRIWRQISSQIFLITHKNGYVLVVQNGVPDEVRLANVPPGVKECALPHEHPFELVIHLSILQ